ncbi:MAG TPA: hypothetical protein VGL59_16070 [Polyangia bacterium]|jgi:hypothetical protein
MKRSLGTTILLLSIAVGLVAGQASVGAAKDNGDKVAAQPKVAKGKKTSAASPAVPAGVTVNACGCYRTEAGACFCGDKNGKCMCPGDCEPMACEQKRSKEMQREIAAETKKAQDDEKKRQADEDAAEAAAVARAAAARADAGPLSSGDSVSEDTDETSEQASEKKADDPKPEKPAAGKSRKRSLAKP